MTFENSIIICLYLSIVRDKTISGKLERLCFWLFTGNASRSRHQRWPEGLIRANRKATRDQYRDLCVPSNILQYSDKSRKLASRSYDSTLNLFRSMALFDIIKPALEL